MGDLGKRKEGDGGGCFDEFIDSFDKLINKYHDEIIYHLKAVNCNILIVHTQKQMQVDRVLRLQTPALHIT